ncbi:MAG: GumC family protein [bacterium]
MENSTLNLVKVQIAWHGFKKNKWRILALVVATALAVAAGSLLQSPVYRASSRLLVKPGREDVYVSPAGDVPVVTDRSTTQDYKLNSEIEILKSPLLARKLIERMGLEQLFSFPDRSYKALVFKGGRRKELPSAETASRIIQSRLGVSVVPKSNVIDLNFDWGDPEVAKQALDTFVDIYLIHHLMVHTDPETYDLLKNQANQWGEKLTESEKKLEAFKSKYSITSLNEQKSNLLQTLSSLEAETLQTRSEIGETSMLIASLERRLSSLSHNVRLQETVNQQSGTLAALKARLVELELQGLKEETARVRKMIAEEEQKGQVTVVSGESPLRQSLETDLLKARAQLAALQAKVTSRDAQAATLREKLKSFDGIEQRLGELHREVAIRESNYKLYLSKFEEAKISESMDQQKISNISVIEPAAIRSQPVRPKMLLNILVGALVAFVAGTGLVLLKEFVYPVFRTREDVSESLELPVVAVLPKQ